jgi:hypothetical protein
VTYSWQRIGGRSVDRAFLLLADDVSTGWTVEHCGHPTANWPYTAHDASGRLILAPNGKGFQKLAYAQTAAIYLASGGKQWASQSAKRDFIYFYGRDPLGRDRIGDAP